MQARSRTACAGVCQVPGRCWHVSLGTASTCRTGVLLPGWPAGGAWAHVVPCPNHCTLRPRHLSDPMYILTPWVQTASTMPAPRLSQHPRHFCYARTLSPSAVVHTGLPAHALYIPTCLPPAARHQAASRHATGRTGAPAVQPPRVYLVHGSSLAAATAAVGHLGQAALAKCTRLCYD